MNEDENLEFERLKNKKYSKEDINTAIEKEEYAEKLAEKGPLKKLQGDIIAMFNMLKNPKNLSPATITLVAGVLIYLISPIDLVPDFIPVAGLLDDAAIITAAIASLGKDLDNFKNK